MRREIRRRKFTSDIDSDVDVDIDKMFAGILIQRICNRLMQLLAFALIDH